MIEYGSPQYKEIQIINFGDTVLTDPQKLPSAAQATLTELDKNGSGEVDEVELLGATSCFAN